jgi:hypothetical protein
LENYLLRNNRGLLNWLNTRIDMQIDWAGTTDFAGQPGQARLEMETNFEARQAKRTVGFEAVETDFEVRQAKRTAGAEAVEPNFEARRAKRTVGFEAAETDFEVL